ncbi:MAG: LUD domain-containing protein [Bacteroidota bacterium]|nr:LUD domain-containing protein [Bacteroidota bacterium]
MKESSSKEKILKRVRKALLQKSETNTTAIDWESDVFTKEEGTTLEVFAANFVKNHGHFIYCYHEHHFLDQFLSAAEEHSWKKIVCLEDRLKYLFNACEHPVLTTTESVKEADAGITGCEVLIARTGSVVVNSIGNRSRGISVFPPVHIVIAYRKQLLYDLKDYFRHYLRRQGSLPSMTSIISGPSRTADIEKTIVLGAHGPKEFFVFFIDED